MTPGACNPALPTFPVPEPLAELATGSMVILVREENRESEGDRVLGRARHAPVPVLAST